MYGVREDVARHLKKKWTFFAKFYLLKGDKDGSCSVMVRDEPVNLGDGEGKQTFTHDSQCE